ncbi:MAG: 16S rRNA (cytosine(967)-C(5))-methyltransferase RsmB, partial [Gammaproteobacteria bacterium]|nr:16S rRNA (cytosine(967)-C(5))-methyltransferase RsmB [Gammaproteobacteria bacterium]
MPISFRVRDWAMGAKQSSDKDARLVALKVLRGVLNDGESLTTVLPPALETCSNQDRAFAQMLVYGVLRFRWQIEAILGQLLARPLKAKDSDLKLILMLAVFQLLHSRVPDYATVDAAVKQVKRTGKSWARGLVNGVLRSFQRQQDELLKNIESDDCAAYSHPQWIIEKLQADWPEHWHSILEANNQQAPMVLRVNARHFSAQEYADKLSQSAEIDSHAHQALVLQQASDVTELPGYTHGWFSVQDAGAQLA